MLFSNHRGIKGDRFPFEKRDGPGFELSQGNGIAVGFID
jgi:hypothetical protein